MTLDKKDLFWVAQRIPAPLRDMMRRQTSGLVVAGGFIRACVSGEKPADIDLFVPSKEAALVLATEFSKGGRLIKTDNAYTVADRFSLSVQFIHRWTYSNPASLVESFDFTIARAAVWCGWRKGEWHSLCDERFYVDLAAKRLNYCNPQRNEDAGGSILRVLKFYQRGYRIHLDSLASVIVRLMRGVNQEELMGMKGDYETNLAVILTGLLHEVDPLADPEHLAHLPSSTDTPADEGERDEVA